MSDTASTTLPIAADIARPRLLPPRVLRGGADVGRFYSTFIMGAGFPAVAGMLFFGWRALAMLIVMLAVAIAAIHIWRQIGARGRQLHLGHGIWSTLLLWLMLPAHLFNTATPTFRYDLWPIPIAAAILLVIMLWLLGGVGSGRIHPVLVTYLLVVAIFDPLLSPASVLQRNRLFTGDIASAAPPAPPAHAYIKDGYLRTTHLNGYDALQVEPAQARLLSFTSGAKRPGRSWLSLESLLRDEMPPLEDLVIGAQPGPSGATCAVALIIGGLFLLYRGVIDFRVPLLAIIGAYIAWIALPIPVLIREAGPQWQWLAFRDPVNVGPAKAITLANYEIMAGPMLLMIFFFATSPGLRPMARRARVIFGLLVGLTAAGFQLYLSISFGPYLALLIVSLITPMLDRFFRQHPLV